MKLIKSIVRPNKVDEVKDALAKLNISGHDGHGGSRPRQAERAHGDLSRQGIQRQPAAEDGDRDRRARFNRRGSHQGHRAGRPHGRDRRRARVRVSRAGELSDQDGRERIGRAHASTCGGRSEHPNDLYSYRSASIGSRRAARIAGTIPKTMPTVAEKPSPNANDHHGQRHRKSGGEVDRDANRAAQENAQERRRRS